MKKFGTRALVEASLLAALAAIILIISIVMPLIAPIGIIIWPIPIILLTFKYDMRISILSLIVILFIVSGVVGPISAFSMGFIYGIPALVLGFCLKRRYSPFSTIMAATLSTFIANIVLIKFSALFTGTDILNLYFSTFEQSKQKTAEFMKSFGANEQQINQALSQSMNLDLIKIMFPGILALASVISAYVNYYFVGAIFRRLRISINELKPMDQWYINNNLSFGLFFITLATWLMTLLKVPNSDIVFYSIYMIFSGVFVINGLSVLAWFLKNRGLSKKVSIPIIAFALLAGFEQILFFLGLIDYAIDFRKINPSRRRKIPPGE